LDGEGGCYFEIVAEGFGERGGYILGSSNAVQNGMTSTEGWFMIRINMPVVAPAWKLPAEQGAQWVWSEH